MREVSTISTAASWVGQLLKVVAWPAEALEARRVRAELATLSERELSDIAGRRCEPATPWRDESAEDRAARVRAIRAWYGRVQKAA